MPKQIWDEGRTVGLSAYEIYVKQHLAEDPTSAPSTEKEWLASSLAMGTSMLLKVPNIDVNNRANVFIDIQLPHNSNLAAANTIVATFFDGDADFPEADSDYPDEQYWATRVTDYGYLIYNKAAYGTKVPPDGDLGPDASIDVDFAGMSIINTRRLRDYVHITGGVVIQPGNWHDSANKPPEKDFYPNLHGTYPRVRLSICGPISNNPRVLLTGFTNSSVLSGIVGTDGSTNTDHPENGDFLGPEDFPWAARIVFSLPNALMSIGLMEYTRTIRRDSTTSWATPSEDYPIVDMRYLNPGIFYESYTSTTDYYGLYHVVESSGAIENPRISYSVDNFTPLPNANGPVLTVYTKWDKRNEYPPALYGTYVSSDGTNYLNPLDVVAPGTVKMFNNQGATRLKNYQTLYPGAWAINRSPDNHLQILDDSTDTLITIANQNDVPPEVTVSSVKLTNSGNTFVTPFGTFDANNSHPRMMQVKVGNTKGYSLMLSSNGATTNPTPYKIDSVPSSSVSITNSAGEDNLAWSALLYALCNEKSIDILGDRLKRSKYSLSKSVSVVATQGGHIWDVNQTNDTNLYNGNGAAFLRFGRESVPSGQEPKDYVKDLYVTEDAPIPSNILHHSVGLGWGNYAAYKRVGSIVHSTANWTPLNGAEYADGELNSIAGSNLNCATIPFNYGLVIFGRVYSHNTTDITSLYDVFESALSSSMSKLCKNYDSNGSVTEKPHPAIAWVDHHGGIFWIVKSSLVDVDGTYKRMFDIHVNHDSDDPYITTSVRLTNYASTIMAPYVLIGNFKFDAYGALNVTYSHRS